MKLKNPAVNLDGTLGCFYYYLNLLLEKKRQSCLPVTLKGALEEEIIILSFTFIHNLVMAGPDR